MKDGFTMANAQNSPAFTAGGKSEADMATPTIDPALFDNTERATPAPEGIAIRAPTQRALACPRCIISVVGHLVTPYDSIHGQKIIPYTKPMSTQIISDITSYFIPRFLSGLSEITAPKIPANIGPIIGETNMDATVTTELFSTKPKKEIVLARITRAT